MTTTTPSDGATILLIDDDRAATELMDKLVISGYVVQLAASAERALARFDVVSADLILLGLMLPDSDGLILCADLSARTNAPVIVLSSRPREVDRLLATELGARDFVTKPVDLDELLSRIRAALGDRGELEPIASAH